MLVNNSFKDKHITNNYYSRKYLWSNYDYYCYYY